jgi:hypothetical protein
MLQRAFMFLTLAPVATRNLAGSRALFAARHHAVHANARDAELEHPEPPLTHRAPTQHRTATETRGAECAPPDELATTTAHASDKPRRAISAALPADAEKTQPPHGRVDDFMNEIKKQGEEHRTRIDELVAQIKLDLIKQRRFGHLHDQVFAELYTGDLIGDFERVVLEMVFAKLDSADCDSFDLTELDVATLPRLLELAGEQGVRGRIVSLVDEVLKNLLYSRVQGVAADGQDTTPLTQEVVQLFESLHEAGNKTAQKAPRRRLLELLPLATDFVRRAGSELSLSPAAVNVVIALVTDVLNVKGDTIAAAVRNFAAQRNL